MLILIVTIYHRCNTNFQTGDFLIELFIVDIVRSGDKGTLF